jgi:hypothetical protein
MEFGYLGCAIWLAICMVDLHSHNKKLEKMFPDESNADHRNKRMELSISLYGFGFLMVILIGLFVRSIFVK